MVVGLLMTIVGVTTASGLDINQLGWIAIAIGLGLAVLIESNRSKRNTTSPNGSKPDIARNTSHAPRVIPGAKSTSATALGAQGHQVRHANRQRDSHRERVRTRGARSGHLLSRRVSQLLAKLGGLFPEPPPPDNINSVDAHACDFARSGLLFAVCCFNSLTTEGEGRTGTILPPNRISEETAEDLVQFLFIYFLHLACCGGTTSAVSKATGLDADQFRDKVANLWMFDEYDHRDYDEFESLAGKPGEVMALFDGILDRVHACPADIDVTIEGNRLAGENFILVMVVVRIVRNWFDSLMAQFPMREAPSTTAHMILFQVGEDPFSEKWRHLSQ